MTKWRLAFAAPLVWVGMSFAIAGEASADREGKAQELELRIFRIAYISPNLPCPSLSDESLLDVLKMMKSPGGSIDFEKRVNALIVHDELDNLNAMQQVVERADLPPKAIDDPDAVNRKSRRDPDSIFSANFTERPLKQVLDYLSEVSGKEITTAKAKDQKMLVSINLKNTTYRAALAVIALKYNMDIDCSQTKDNTVVISSPEKVSMVVRHADIRDVINLIAIQSDAKIVMGPEVTGDVSARFEGTRWREALDAVARQLDFVVVNEIDGTVRVTSPYKITSYHGAADKIPITDELRKSAAAAIAAYGKEIVISHTLEIGQRIEGTVLLRNNGDKHVVKLELTLVIPIKDQEEPFEQRLVFSEKDWNFPILTTEKDVPVVLRRIDMPSPTLNAEPEFRITYLQFAQ